MNIFILLLMLMEYFELILAINPSFIEQSIPENWDDNYNYACSGDDYNYADGDTYGMEDTWGDY